MESSTFRDESSRRARVSCRICGRSLELLRLREHLRAEHQSDTASIESIYLSARIEARKSQRSRSA